MMGFEDIHNSEDDDTEYFSSGSAVKPVYKSDVKDYDVVDYDVSRTENKGLRDRESIRESEEEDPWEKFRI